MRLCAWGLVDSQAPFNLSSLPRTPPELTGHARNELSIQPQGGFGLLELLVNDASENHLLVGVGERLRGKVDSALGQFGEVGFVGAGGQEFVGVLRREPDREAPRPPLSGERTEE